MELTDHPTTIGVIGGGQLCRMMAEAAAPLGFEVVFLDPTPNAPARPVARKQIVGNFDEGEPLKRLLNYSDYLTYDIELADAELIESIRPDQPIHPDLSTLLTIQDKLRQKRTLEDEGVPVPAFRKVDEEEDLREAGDELGYPLMVKARHGGYDGRGTFHLPSEEAVPEAREELEGPLMAEALVDFDRELSVIGVKNSRGIAIYPPTQTVHEEEILRHTLSPAPVDETVAERAKEVAEQSLELLEGRGTFGIELFQDGEEILLNEIAPRPHNSGHWTIEGAVTSQFENHVRGVTDRPLGSTETREASVTVNILGSEGKRPVRLTGTDAILEHSRAHLHWYGKKEERPLRKMGHFTLTGEENPEALLPEAKELEEQLSFEP